ncbi:MAG: aldehyde dehydrogenase family protein [Acidobacteria bacterium]|nr:aldehyde dehydrogenase family protein [Acidobacteriota bacterium]
MRIEGHFIGGAWRAGDERFEVVNPFSGEALAECARGGPPDIDAAVAAAVAAMRDPLPAHARAEMCDRIAAGIRANLEAFAREICAEAAKPIRQARAEAERAASTWTFAAAEARTLAGEAVPMDAAAAGAGKLAFTIREPRGVVGAITPFNFPLNLVGHKLAPALAAGCAVVLKPAEKTPLSAIALVRLMRDAGVPKGWVNLVTGFGEEAAAPLAAHPDVAILTFTGSTRVGWALAGRAARKRVLLELGSNAPVLVEPDADLARAAAKVRLAGFAHAGQSCVSVQRIFVHRDVHDEFLRLLVPAVESLVVGDPAAEETEVGPLIRPAEAERVLAWVREAEAAGARVLTGGGGRDGFVTPTVVAGAAPEMRVCAEEIFGPVVSVIAYRSLDEAIDTANRSPYGLNAGVFTRSIEAGLRAARRLRAAAVLVNEVPTWRADQMPYGGMGESGNTREGPRYAIREMTQEKLVVLDG